MEGYLSAELTATCTALGYYDGSNYYLAKYCLGKDSYFILFGNNLFKNKYCLTV